MCVCVRAQITGGFAGPIRTEEEVHTVIRKVLKHLTTFRELIGAKIVVSVEANVPVVADMVEQAAALWSRETKTTVVFHGDWVSQTKVDISERPTAVLRPGTGATPGVERHMGRRTTNTSKCTGAIQLNTTLQEGGVRFSHQLRIESMDDTEPESVAITRFLVKMRSQLGQFVRVRTPAGGITMHGKGPNRVKNDDTVMVLIFLNGMVLEVDSATLALYRR